jgi:hypothetical protein
MSWREKLNVAFYESGDTSDRSRKSGDKSRTSVTKETTSVTSVTGSLITENAFSDQEVVEARRLLNESECRLWTDADGNTYIGVWECVDTEDVSRAAALVVPGAKVLHLERPEVPMPLKVMSGKIAGIEDARWQKWR